MYLNCHSFHSLRYGTIPLQDLVAQAAAFGVREMALTDINTVTGIYEYVRACEAVCIKPLVGIEFRDHHKFLYIGLALNREGIGEMNRLITEHNFGNMSLPERAPDFKNVIVIYTLENCPPDLKANEYMGIRPEQLPKLFNPIWKNRMNKMVVLQPVTFRTKKEYNLHKILRAIDLNVIGSRLSDADCCRTSEIMLPLCELEAKFEDYPAILENTKKIIGQ